MNSNLVFDFTVDKTTNTVLVNKEFAANLSMVWDAFTKQEILDQWWAPKPWSSRTKFMDFTEGGRRFYAMVSPEGQEHWSIQKFSSISPRTNIQYSNAFSDKDEQIDEAMPNSNWDVNFRERNGVTTVSIVIKFKTLADLEKIVQMGFNEGFTATLNQMEKMLKNIN